MSEDRPLTPDETARVVELAMHFAREGMTESSPGSSSTGCPPTSRTRTATRR